MIDMMLKITIYYNIYKDYKTRLNKCRRNKISGMDGIIISTLKRVERNFFRVVDSQGCSNVASSNGTP